MLVMKPYSEDLRRKIVANVEGGMPKTEAAPRLFGVGLSSVKRYCGLAAREEPLAPARAAGGPPRRTPSSRDCSKRTWVGAPTPPPGSVRTSSAVRAGSSCRRPP
jgi:transposase